MYFIKMMEYTRERKVRYSRNKKQLGEQWRVLLLKMVNGDKDDN